MHPHLSMHSCQPGLATASRLQLQRHASRVASMAMPFQLPNAGQLSRKLNPLQLLPGPQPTKPQQPRQQPNHSQNHIAADGTSYSTQVVPSGTGQQPVPAAPVAVPGNSSTGLSLKFAKHLANVSNGCAPPTSRFESLGWLLFESKRLQASLIGSSPSIVGSWLCSADSMQLLEQIYLVGAAIAELGSADGLQPMSSSNGSRAIVSLDYSRLLERYLQQHGQLLAEDFWSQLHAHDDLQVRAVLHQHLVVVEVTALRCRMARSICAPSGRSLLAQQQLLLACPGLGLCLAALCGPRGCARKSVGLLVCKYQFLCDTCCLLLHWGVMTMLECHDHGACGIACVCPRRLGPSMCLQPWKHAAWCMPCCLTSLSSA